MECLRHLQVLLLGNNRQLIEGLQGGKQSITLCNFIMHCVTAVGKSVFGGYFMTAAFFVSKFSQNTTFLPQT